MNIYLYCGTWDIPAWNKKKKLCANMYTYKLSSHILSQVEKKKS